MVQTVAPRADGEPARVAEVGHCAAWEPSKRVALYEQNVEETVFVIIAEAVVAVAEEVDRGQPGVVESWVETEEVAEGASRLEDREAFVYLEAAHELENMEAVSDLGHWEDRRSAVGEEEEVRFRQMAVEGLHGHWDALLLAP